MPSRGAGPDASAFDRQLLEWRAGDLQYKEPKHRRTPKPDYSRDARDDRRFEMKTHVATIAMHLDPNWRQSLFKQLDLLLDIGDADWEGEHELPTLASWKTFIRLVIHYRFRSRPALSTFEGNISATWIQGDIRVTIECLANDDIRWIASRDVVGKDDREAAAGETTLKRVLAFLSPFDVVDWLVDGAS